MLFPSYSYKPSSLVRKFVNYGQKKFYNIGPRRETVAKKPFHGFEIAADIPLVKPT
jgi:hypothetical protein